MLRLRRCLGLGVVLGLIAVFGVGAARAQQVGDAGKKGPPDNALMLKTYNVPGGNADAVVKLLQEIYKDSATVRLAAIGKLSVMVYASPRDRREILRLLSARSIQRRPGNAVQATSASDCPPHHN